MNDGEIVVSLTCEGGRIVRVAIDNRRLLSLADTFVGLAPEEAAGRLSRLFAICRFGQGIVGARAIERALGIALSPSQQAARDLLIGAEIVLDHANRALLDWPGLCGSAPAVKPLKEIRGPLADLWRALYPGGDWMRPGGGRLVPDRAGLAGRIDRAEQALDRAGLMPPSTVTDFDVWSRNEGPAPAFLNWLEQKGVSACGQAGTEFLSGLDGPWLAARLADDSSFGALPEIGGAARETGALVRQWDQPLVRAAVARHGAGLFARFLAQLVEIPRVLGEMRDFAGRVCDDDGTRPGTGTGAGLASAEVARGWLAHRVVIADGVIRCYQIVAPTEWNFHPRGTLVAGLLGTPRGPEPAVLARLMVGALDPCVAVSLRVEANA